MSHLYNDKILQNASEFSPTSRKHYSDSVGAEVLRGVAGFECLEMSSVSQQRVICFPQQALKLHIINACCYTFCFCPLYCSYKLTICLFLGQK